MKGVGGRHALRKRERGRERVLPQAHCRMAATARSGPGQARSWELGLSLPHGWRGPASGHLLLPSQGAGGKLYWKLKQNLSWASIRDVSIASVAFSCFAAMRAREVTAI